MNHEHPIQKPQEALRAFLCAERIFTPHSKRTPP